jgi:hypothetical protein
MALNRAIMEIDTEFRNFGAYEGDFVLLAGAHFGAIRFSFFKCSVNTYTVSPFPVSRSLPPVQGISVNSFGTFSDFLPVKHYAKNTKAETYIHSG